MSDSFTSHIEVHSRRRTLRVRDRFTTSRKTDLGDSGRPRLKGVSNEPNNVKPQSPTPTGLDTQKSQPTREMDPGCRTGVGVETRGHGV